MKTIQNHVFTEDYAIVKACFKLNNFENIIKVVFVCDRGE